MHLNQPKVSRLKVGLWAAAALLMVVVLRMLAQDMGLFPNESYPTTTAVQTAANNLSGGPNVPGGPAPTNPPRSATGDNLDGRCIFFLGQQVAFEVSFDKRLEFGAFSANNLGVGSVPRVSAKSDGARKEIRTALRARIDGLVVAAIRSDSALLAVQLTDMTHTPALSDAIESVQADVKRPYLLRITEACRIIDSARLTGSSPLAHEQIINIFAAFDFDADARPAGSRYVAQHRDGYGSHSATYEVVPGNGRGSLHRRRLRYASTSAGLGELGFEVTIRASDATLRLGTSLWLESVKETLTLQIDQNAGVPIVDDSTVEIRAVPVDPSLRSALALPVSGYQWGRPSANALDAERASLLHTDLRGVPLSDILTRYRDILSARGNLGIQEGQQLLRAWLVQNPEGAAAMATAMRGGELTDSKNADLALALAKAGTPEGLKALKEVAFDRAATENVRAQAASALGDAKTPTRETVSALEALATGEVGNSTYGFVKSTASMAMGSLAADQGGAVGEAALEAIGRQLSSDDSGARMLAFYAAGNSGDPRFIGAVRETFEHSDDPMMRAAAIRATRLMPPDKVEELLMAAMTKETDSEVQKAIVDAQGSQQHLLNQPAQPKLLALYKIQLPTAAPAVRAEMIHVLGISARLRPEAKAVLLWWYPQEPLTALKVAIGGYINVGEAGSQSP